MIKMTFQALLLFSLISSCKLNFYGDISLGSNFYYMVEPAFNSIVIPVDSKKPYHSSTLVIQDIEELGFDKNYILAKSKLDARKRYWIIDKRMESKNIGYENHSILKLSNVFEVDSIKFVNKLKQTSIELKTKTFYRKKQHYE